MFGKAEILKAENEKRKLIGSPRHPGGVRFRLDRQISFHQDFPTTIRKMKIKTVTMIN